MSDPVGNISYGVAFDEDFEFPWDAEPWEGDIEHWWLDVSGYVNPHEYPYDERGNYKPGHCAHTADPYWDARSGWRKDNPLPIVLLVCHSHDYGSYILAARNTVDYAHEGGPVAIDPALMTVEQEDHDALIDFIHDYCIYPLGMNDVPIVDDPDPTWYLSAHN
jgi:hypothetical protein